MALQTKYLQFAKATATGLQTVTGVGFRGKALLLWTSHQTALGATTAAALSIGMTDGILQSVRAIVHPGAETATTSAQAERTNRIAWHSNATSGATPTVDVEGQFFAWTSDGFTIDWIANDGNATIYHALVLGGDIQARFTQVKVTVGAGSPQSVTGVGFRPSAFIVMGGAADGFGVGDYNDGAPFGSVHGFGFSNATDNVCGWTLGLGTGGAADNYRGQHTDRASSVRAANVAGAAELMGMHISSADVDGYTLTRDVGSSSYQPVQHVLCLRGVKFSLGTFNAPTSTGAQALALPFQPDLLMLQSLGTTASANTSGLDLGMGVFQRVDNVAGGIWIGGVDAASPSVYRRSAYSGSVLETRNPSTGALALQASVASVSGTGASLDFTSVSGSADAIIYMAIGAVGIRGSAVFGEKGTIEGADRAVLLSLDGNTNVHTDPDTLKVCGDVVVTGDSTLAATGIGTAPDAHAALAIGGQYYGADFNAGNSGAALTIDWENGNTQIVTLTANCTFTFTNGKAGGRYLLIVLQDATGGRTVTWPAAVKWSAATAPTLSPAASALDLVTFAFTSASSGIYLAAANLDVR